MAGFRGFQLMEINVATGFPGTLFFCLEAKQGGVLAWHILDGRSSSREVFFPPKSNRILQGGGVVIPLIFPTGSLRFPNLS